MKTKDIEIGAEYAIGAPNASYDRPIRCRVVKVRVYGETRPAGSWRSYCSDHPSYVEIEPLDGGSLGRRHECKVSLETDKPITHGIHGPRKEIPSRTAYRVPAGWVLRTWAEQEALNERQRQQRRASEKREQAAEARMRAVIKDLATVGVTARERLRLGRTDGIQLSLEAAERLIEVLKR